MIFMAQFTRKQKSPVNGYKRYKMQLLFRANSKEDVEDFIRKLDDVEDPIAIRKMKENQLLSMCACAEYGVVGKKYYVLNCWIASNYSRSKFERGWRTVLQNNDSNDFNSEVISNKGNTVQYYTKLKDEIKYYTFLNFKPKIIDLREVKYYGQEEEEELGI